MSEKKVVIGWRWGADSGPFIEGPADEVDAALEAVDQWWAAQEKPAQEESDPEALP